MNHQQSTGRAPHSGFADPGAIAAASAARAVHLRARVEELAALKDGWLDGSGVALSREGLTWLADCFDCKLAPAVPEPRLYPTPSGAVLAEWVAGRWDISLEIDLTSRRASYDALHLEMETDDRAELDLGTEAGWKALNERLQATLPPELARTA